MPNFPELLWPPLNSKSSQVENEMVELSFLGFERAWSRGKISGVHVTESAKKMFFFPARVLRIGKTKKHSIKYSGIMSVTVIGEAWE